MKDFIKINQNDNVIVAIKELAEGEKVTVDGKEYTAAETIPAGHSGCMYTISKQRSAICSLIPTSL